ncbi:MAG TPA: sigma-70 family RNA polymerase sigma factor, partial [Gemmata sp.]|nr:sigma-70 family RNA polymerase sigma factor [Gemmata sp.]
METNPLKVVIQHLMADGGPDGGGMTDGELLALFLSSRDDNALAALVCRHAPMVWGVCRRLLQYHHDAEDAFQATFLVLVRKAVDVPKQAVANWLYGVARQTAVRLRATAAKRGRREMQVMNMPEPSMGEVRDGNLQDVLDNELIRLPDHYRSVIVLCDLEGMTRQEAARQLAIPEGSVASRLARARTMLAKRLARHGLAVSGGALAAGLTEMVASAGAPTSLVPSTIKAANLLAAGKTAGAISVKVAALTEGVINAIMINKVKTITGVLVAVLAATTFAYGMMLDGQPGGGGDESDSPDRLEPTTTPNQKVAPPQQKPVEPDADRAAAEWVIAHGGTIRTGAGTFGKGDPLGDGPFKITAINLGPTNKIEDNDLARFKDLTKLNNLSLANTSIGDAGLKHLAGLKSLESLYLPNTKVGDAGLAHLKGMTGLVNLYLDETKVTDAGLERLSGMRGLSVLYLRHTQITDAGLKHIKAMPNLCWVDLWGTKVTHAGVRELQAALPRCTIKNVDPKNDRPPPPKANQPADVKTEEVAHLAKKSAANPQDTLLSLDVAALQAWFGQDEELAATRKRVLAFANGTSDVKTAHRAVYCCLIRPVTDEAELQAALALARTAVSAGKDGQLYDQAFDLLALGMAEYRGGNHAAAEKALLAAEKASPVNALVTGTSPFYRALSLFRQGKVEEARKLATESAAKMKPLPRDYDPLASAVNHNHLILWLAYKEAKAVIQFDAAPPPKVEAKEKGTDASTTAPDRRAAEYVLSIGGSVRVNDDISAIAAVAELPQGTFRLTCLDLHANQQVTDEGLAIVKDCKNISIIYFDGTAALTDVGLANFRNCKSISQLHLQGTKVTDAGLAQFDGSRIITDLCLSGPGVTDAGLAHFKDCKELTTLHLGATKVSAAGLAVFWDCKHLRELNLEATEIGDRSLPQIKGYSALRYLVVRKTKFTAGDVSELAIALPLCKIEHDGGVIEPTRSKKSDRLEPTGTKAVTQAEQPKERSADPKQPAQEQKSPAENAKPYTAFPDLKLPGTDFLDRKLPHTKVQENREAMNALVMAGIPIDLPMNHTPLQKVQYEQVRGGLRYYSAHTNFFDNGYWIPANRDMYMNMVDQLYEVAAQMAPGRKDKVRSYQARVLVFKELEKLYERRVNDGSSLSFELDLVRFRRLQAEAALMGLAGGAPLPDLEPKPIPAKAADLKLDKPLPAYTAFLKLKLPEPLFDKDYHAKMDDLVIKGILRDPPQDHSLLERVRYEQVRAGLASLNKMQTLIGIGKWRVDYCLIKYLQIALQVYPVAAELESTAEGKIRCYEAGVLVLKEIEAITETRVEAGRDPSFDLET